MPVNHMIWIKFNEGVGQEAIAAHLRGLASLRTRVPGILDLSVGENFTDRAQGHTHGLSVILKDRVALAAYATDPAHVEVAGKLRQDAVVMALDYEFSETPA